MPGPILPPGPGNIPSQLVGGTCARKIQDFISEAMIELGVLDPTEQAEPDELATGLIKLNALLDAWATQRRYIYGNNFFVGNLTPNLVPHLIGPGGSANFVINVRPVRIESANILLNSPGPATVRSQVRVHQDMGAWWDSQRAPSIASVLPTDLYYQPDWPNGKMFLWVVPTVAYPLELMLNTIFDQVQLNTQACFPPGYYDALLYSLAVRMATSFGDVVSPQHLAELKELRREAVARVINVNIVSPAMGTRDAGIPSQESGNRATYNYLTKQNN